MTFNPTKRVLRLQAVINKTGLSRSSIYLYIKKGAFPKPIRLGTRSVGWIENDINEWIDSRTNLNRSSL